MSRTEPGLPLRRHLRLRAAFTLALLVLCAGCGKVNEGEPSDASLSDSPSCEQYCDSVMQACAGENAVYTRREVCLAVCAGFEPGDPTEPTGNTLSCRAAHARLAEREPGAECTAAGPGGGGRCGDDCAGYCALYAQFCPQQASAQAGDVDDCITQCGALTDQSSFDLIRDHGGNTLECRLVHVSSASVEPEPHCEHARLEPTSPWCVDSD